MRCAGRPDEHIVLFFFHIVMPVKELFIILRRNEFRKDILPATGWHDHEHIPGRGAKLLGKFIYFGDFLLVPFSKGRVDQKFNIVFPEKSCSSKRTFKSALLVAKIVVHLSRGPVKT